MKVDCEGWVLLFVWQENFAVFHSGSIKTNGGLHCRAVGDEEMASFRCFFNFCYLLAGFDVAKTGDARIGFVGFPSVGKSTLLSNLAGVYSEVAAYEFTTLTTVPGVIRYKGAKIQVRSSDVCEDKTVYRDVMVSGQNSLVGC